jgi:hypothetical protein
LARTLTQTQTGPVTQTRHRSDFSPRDEGLTDADSFGYDDQSYQPKDPLPKMAAKYPTGNPVPKKNPDHAVKEYDSDVFQSVERGELPKNISFRTVMFRSISELLYKPDIEKSNIEKKVDMIFMDYLPKNFTKRHSAFAASISKQPARNLNLSKITNKNYTNGPEEFWSDVLEGTRGQKYTGYPVGIPKYHRPLLGKGGLRARARSERVPKNFVIPEDLNEDDQSVAGTKLRRYHTDITDKVTTQHGESDRGIGMNHVQVGHIENFNRVYNLDAMRTNDSRDIPLDRGFARGMTTMVGQKNTKVDEKMDRGISRGLTQIVRQINTGDDQQMDGGLSRGLTQMMGQMDNKNTRINILDNSLGVSGDMAFNSPKVNWDFTPTSGTAGVETKGSPNLGLGNRGGDVERPANNFSIVVETKTIEKKFTCNGGV